MVMLILMVVQVNESVVIFFVDIREQYVVGVYYIDSVKKSLFFQYMKMVIEKVDILIIDFEVKIYSFLLKRV